MNNSTMTELLICAMMKVGGFWVIYLKRCSNLSTGILILDSFDIVGMRQCSLDNIAVYVSIPK